MTETPTADPWAEDEDTATPESPPAEKPAEKPADPAPGASAPTPDPEPAKEPEKPAEQASSAKPPAKKAAAAAPGRKVHTMGAKLSDQTTFVHLLVYGPEGTGKTTDVLRMTTMAKPGQRVFLIDAEAGAKKQALVQRGVDVSKVEVWPTQEDGGPGALTFEGLYSVSEHLAEHADEYVGWVWDSGTEITKRLLDQVTSEARVKADKLGKNRGRFEVFLEDHGVASAMLRELLRRFLDLPMHGGITALERRDQDNDTGKVKYGPAMAPAMANDSAGLVDIVTWKVVETVNGEEVRSARTVPTPIRRAKDRFGVLPSKLADPYFDRIVAYVEGEMTKDNDPVQAHVRELAEAAKAAKAPPADDKKKEN